MIINGTITKIYNLYLEAGLISNQVTFDMFSNSTREQQAGLYDAGTRAGFITQTPFEQFETDFCKKKPEGEPTDSPLETGGSDSSADELRNFGREYDTLSIKIANLQNQIDEQLDDTAAIPMTTEEIITTPAVETPEMIELESLKKQRDEVLKNINQRVKDAPPSPVITEEMEREKEMDICRCSLRVS